MKLRTPPGAAVSNMLLGFSLVYWPMEAKIIKAMTNVGQRLKMLRSGMGISQRELASVCGCSSSFVSQIELEQTSPSVDSLERICQGLGITLIQFLEQESPDSNAVVVRGADPRQILNRWEGATLEFLMPAQATSAFSTLRLRIQAHGATALRSARRHMDEIGFVVAGTAQFRLDHKMLVLHQGDCVSFDLSTPHQWLNPGDDWLEVLLVNANFTEVFEIEPPAPVRENIHQAVNGGPSAG